MMAKLKLASAELRSIEECQEAMRKLRLARDLAVRMQANCDQAKAAAEQKYAGGIKAAVDEQVEMTLQMQVYYMAHLRDLETDGKRSVQLTHGVMGRRLSPPALKLANKSWTWQSVLAKLREKWGETFVRHQEPEVDKQAVKDSALDAEALHECGLRLEQDEVFFAEPAPVAPVVMEA